MNHKTGIPNQGRGPRCEDQRTSADFHLRNSARTKNFSQIYAELNADLRRARAL